MLSFPTKLHPTNHPPIDHIWGNWELHACIWMCVCHIFYNGASHCGDRAHHSMTTNKWKLKVFYWHGLVLTAPTLNVKQFIATTINTNHQPIQTLSCTPYTSILPSRSGRGILNGINRNLINSTRLANKQVTYQSTQLTHWSLVCLTTTMEIWRVHSTSEMNREK